MAEKGDEEDDATVQSSVSTWWGSFYDSAKQKLAETNEFIVRDIQEFTQTVKSDTSKLVADAATSMKDQLNITVNLDEASNATKVVTNSITGFLGKVVHHVTPIPPEDAENEDSTMFLGTSSGVKVMSPAEARLFNLQISPATYCNEPDNVIEFDFWLESFALDAKKEELSLLMLDSKEVRSLYTKLVPEAVSHVDFWTRYFYKKHQLEKAEERRTMLVERAQSKETELVWDDEDDYDVVNYPDVSEPAVKTEAESVGKEELKPIISDVASEVTKTVDDEINVVQDAASTEEPKKVPTASEDEPGSVLPNSASSSESQDKTLTVANNDNVVDRNDVIADDVIESVATPPIDQAEQGNIDKSVVIDNKIISGPESQPSALHADAADKSLNDSASTENTCDEKQESIPSKVVESTSGDSSDWEKEFDLDMTEDEINQALQQDDQVDDLEDWEEWE